MIPRSYASKALALAQPLSALLELTYHCNWRCVFCYNPRHSDIKRMSADEWCVVLDDLRRLGTLSVTLTGGEPLTHPEFFRIAREVRSRAFGLRIFTNGTLIDDRAADEIAELLPMAVEMSIHGSTPETHERATMKVGSYTRLLETVDRLLAREAKVYLKAPITSLNEHEVDEMVALAQRLHVPLSFDVTITPRDDGDTAPLAYTASPETRRRLMKSMGVHESHRQTGDVNCGLGRTTLAVDPEGNVYPCMQWRHQSLGNVRSTRLEEMWTTSPKRAEIAQVSIDANDALIAIGGPAASFSFCPAIAFQESGNPLVPDRDFLERAAIAHDIRKEQTSSEDLKA